MTDRVPAARNRNKEPKRKAGRITKRQQQAEQAEKPGNADELGLPHGDAAEQFVLQGRLSEEDIEIFQEM
jgi:hypothetical protein